MKDMIDKSVITSASVVAYIVFVSILFVFAVQYALTLFSSFEQKCCQNCWKEEEKSKEKKDDETNLLVCLIAIIYSAIKITHIVLAIVMVIIEFITFQECFWKGNYKVRIILSAIATIGVYLYILTINSIILKTFLVTSIASTDNRDLSLAIGSLCLCIFLIIWEFFYFFYFSMYVPKSLRDVKPCQFAFAKFKCNKTKIDPEKQELEFANGFARFMRKSEINTSFCILGSVCGSTNLEHILKCHSELHIPTRRCNPYYCCTCRSNYLVGFHQTNPDYVRGITLNGMQPGTEGMFGGGIYFARSIDHTFGKAHNLGAFIIALVDMGRMVKLVKSQRDITRTSLNQAGYDSVYAEAGVDLNRDEFIVYEASRVKQWIVCY